MARKPHKIAKDDHGLCGEHHEVRRGGVAAVFLRQQPAVPTDHTDQDGLTAVARVHRHQDLRQEAAGRVRCRGHQPLDVQHRWVAPEVQQVLQAGVDEDGWDTRYMR